MHLTPDGNALDASQGDAQSDAFGGMSIILMALFLAMVTILIVFLAVMKQSLPDPVKAEQAQKVAAENERLSSELLAKSEELKTKSAKASALEKKIEKLEAESSALKQKLATQGAQKKGGFSTTGMVIWEDHDDVFITDSKSVGGVWTQRYTCTKKVRKIGSGGNAKSTPIIK